MSPLFFKDEDLAECTENARIFFLGLMTQADRAGRLEDRPHRLKGEIFPYHNVDVLELLEELSAERQWSLGTFITRYKVDGRRYIQINSFLKYQHPHPHEPASTIPPFSQCQKEQPAAPDNVTTAPDNVTAAPDNVGSSKALPSFPSFPSFPSEPSIPSGVPPSPASGSDNAGSASDETDPHAFTAELVAEIQQHLPDSGVKAHPGLTTAVANLLEVGHPGGPVSASNARTHPLTREDLVDAVHGWILAEQGDSWHAQQRAKGDPFTFSRLLTQAFHRLPDYAEKGRAGWGRESGRGITGFGRERAPPIEAPVDPEITARHHARDAERMAKVKAWREEKPPEDLPAREERKWLEEHKRRRP